VGHQQREHHMSTLNKLYEKWIAADEAAYDAASDAAKARLEYEDAYKDSPREERRAHLIALNGHDWDLEDE